MLHTFYFLLYILIFCSAIDTSNCFFGLNLYAHPTFTSKKKYKYITIILDAYIKLLYHTGPPGLKNLYYLTNTLQRYHHFRIIVASQININQS